MDLWSYKKTGYDPESAVEDGNRFLIANGYMGYRGTVEEARSGSFPAVNLAGVYDRYMDKWREPVNAPNGLFTEVSFNGRPMALGSAVPVSHSLEINYRHGVFSRCTDFGPLTVSSERIASAAEPHLLCARVRLSVREAGTVEILTGISEDIWDINGPHLFDFERSTSPCLLTTSISGEKKIPTAVSQTVRADFDCSEEPVDSGFGSMRRLRFNAEPGKEYVLSVFSSVYTGLDCAEPGIAAAELAIKAAAEGIAACFEKNAAVWEKIWKYSAVDLMGNDEAARALHASQYYLNSIAPRHAGNLSIPARGLSGQTYKGAIFWDSEIFLFPMFAHTQPEAAKSLLRYRIETLPGALKKAAEYGYRGAFYAWESQEGGEEGCTNFNVVDVFTHRPVRTYFRDKQIHISGDIAYTLRRYYEITGDRSLLEEGGAEVILQVARFYISRASVHLDSAEADLTDVIGPDEYHERVSNNAFTNRMALYSIESALKLREIFADMPGFVDGLIAKLGYERDWELLSELAARVRRPKTQNGIIEQFDGYFDLEDAPLSVVRSRLCDKREYWGGDHGVAGTTTVIKQADVIAMLALFPDEFSDACIEDNWTYYEPRTEHGSSLSACMYALTACRIGRLDRAWELFMKSASIDITGSSKQWAGEIYIGGTHPAANGGAWMIAVQGFAGLRVNGGEIELHPNLPPELTGIRFPVTAGGRSRIITLTREGCTEEEIQE